MPVVYAPTFESERRRWKAFQKCLGKQTAPKRRPGRPTQPRTFKIIDAIAHAIVQAKHAGKPEADFFRPLYKQFWPRLTFYEASNEFRKFRSRNREKIRVAVRILLTA